LYSPVEEKPNTHFPAILHSFIQIFFGGLWKKNLIGDTVIVGNNRENNCYKLSDIRNNFIVYCVHVS
jgi:hypothetical protein